MSKKNKTIVIVIFLLCIVAGAVYVAADVFNFGAPQHVLRGYSSCEEYFDPHGMQDYTDYCKYYYNSNKDENFAKKYREVSEQDIDRLCEYFENFEQWMKTAERSFEYDFNTYQINVGDYYYIETKEGQQPGYGTYDHYSIYFYDIETHTLYYAHNNI
ncbi:MAG: hypothetical protein Q4F05_02430 [bacterium]|nr:hypothetical protein [bacterium]